MTREEEKTRDLSILQGHVSMLMEHFDTVQILVTRYDSQSEETTRVCWGAGDLYARMGNAAHWAHNMLSADNSVSPEEGEN